MSLSYYASYYKLDRKYTVPRFQNKFCGEIQHDTKCATDKICFYTCQWFHKVITEYNFYCSTSRNNMNNPMQYIFIIY